jgi:hypothetical protein
MRSLLADAAEEGTDLLARRGVSGFFHNGVPRLCSPSSRRSAAPPGCCCSLPPSPPLPTAHPRSAPPVCCPSGALVAGFMGFLIAQVAKVFTHYYTERRWDLSRLVGSGGMPSSHTALVSQPCPAGRLGELAQRTSGAPRCHLHQHHCLTSRGQVKVATLLAATLPPLQVMGMTTAIGVLEGTGSRYFAIALVFSLIVSGCVAAPRKGCWHRSHTGRGLLNVQGLASTKECGRVPLPRPVPVGCMHLQKFSKLPLLYHALPRNPSQPSANIQQSVGCHASLAMSHNFCDPGADCAAGYV